MRWGGVVVGQQEVGVCSKVVEGGGKAADVRQTPSSPLFIMSLVIVALI